MADKNVITLREQKKSVVELSASRQTVSEFTKQQLAINGGSPIIDNEARALAPNWPIVSEKTGEKLKQLYLSGKWSFNGAFEQQFSREFADYHDAKYGILMVNGTTTLECALVALGVKYGGGGGGGAMR